MPADLGSTAPDFTLPNQDRQPVTLSEELRHGPVVLAFFPAAFSDTCTSELCTVRDSFAALGGAVRTFGISVDSFFALKAWAEAQRIGFPLLSDFNKIVIRDYGVFNPNMIGLEGLAKRAVFVIDRSGVIRHREVLDDARNVLDFGAVVRAAAQVSEAG